MRGGGVFRGEALLIIGVEWEEGVISVALGGLGEKSMSLNSSLRLRMIRMLLDTKRINSEHRKNSSK